ncbi:MAG: HU family DNA-binding protein [Spirochaetes bacterium]|nr:HU family DNA-binding protein [Spirochaetota bacterium]
MSKNLSKNAAKDTAKKKVKYPEKCTASAIIQYVSEKNDISKKQAKEIIEDLFDVIRAGAINGERVPVGTFGKLYVRVKPATKARIGRNPITGEEIKIPPKKATKVPKFVFNKAFKEASLGAKVKIK